MNTLCLIVIIYLIFINVILLRFSILNTKQLCNFFNDKNIYEYDSSRINLVKYYFNVIDKLKINYILGFGSELGSYRNHGLIVNDHDVDILIPIWMNYNIFKCKHYIKYFKNPCKRYTSPQYMLCNKTKYEYLMILKNYIKKKLKMKINFKCREWGKYGYTSCWILNNNNTFLDIWILLGNEYVYDDIKICKCKFSENIAYCSNNALENIKRLYGKEYMIPNKKGTGEKICNTILFPTKNNSCIKNI